MPAKRGDLGRPAITITIGAYTFKNALCDFGSSVNIMPKVIYKKINGSPLLYTTMSLQLADLSLLKDRYGEPERGGVNGSR
jgi:hypothetical protein